MQGESKGIRTVPVNPRADQFTKGLIFAATCAVLCCNIQYIVSQWELFAPHPPILFVLLLSLGFAGINLWADAVVVYLVVIASMQTILFWIKQAWYAQINNK